MKRFLKGFTLAEVVITMGIIGVIASVSLPALSVNVQKQQVGPALAKAINTLENANKLALQDNNARRLDQLIVDNKRPAYLRDILSRYIMLVESTPNVKLINSNGSNYAFNNRLSTVYTSPDGITYIPNLNPANSNKEFIKVNNYTGPSHLSGTYTRVFIDINGINKGPNTFNKDLFAVHVDTTGVVIPEGGTLYAQYLNSNSDLWTSKCANTTKPTSNFFCTGAIVENGYQVKYKY